MNTTRLKEFAAITIATVLRKLVCSTTCRPKLDLECNKNINNGNIVYILISAQFYNCFLCCENSRVFSFRATYQNRLINVQCSNERWVKKVLIMPQSDSRKSPSEHLEVCISWRRLCLCIYSMMQQNDSKVVTPWLRMGILDTEQRTPKD